MTGFPEALGAKFKPLCFRVNLCAAIIVAIVLFPFFGSAQQLCTGSLGDPIVNIDFGKGTAPRGPSLGGAITNYYYTASTNQYDPQDSYYTIANSTTGMNYNWHVTYDHTSADGNGYMMVVNASKEPGEFYRVKVEGLCPGTQYEAAAWVMNLLKNYEGLKPNITFRMETATGNLIGAEYNTGDIPQSSNPQWKQYGFFFTTPPNTSEMFLVIRNNGEGGNGNDLVLDDITFRPCGHDVTVSASLSPNEANFCEGENVNLTLSAEVSNEYLNPLLQWQHYKDGQWKDIPEQKTSQTTISLGSDALPGSYLYRLAVGESDVFISEKCRVNSNVFTVRVNPRPAPAASNNGPVCLGKDIVLSANGGGTYVWTGPNGFTSTAASPVIPNADFSMAGTYNVTVISQSGCVETGQTDVLIVEPPVAHAGDDAVICLGDYAILHATGGSTYRWSPAEGLSDPLSQYPSASPLYTTTYTVEVSDGSCSGTDQVTVTVLNPAIASAGPDKSLIEGNSVVLEGSASGSARLSYYWTPSDYLDDPASLHPKASPTEDITYTLHAFSNNGCNDAIDQVFVKVFKKLVIPNAFSPNGDGINDIWNIEALASYYESEVKVFNRYGTIVFSEKGYSKPWDGKFNGQDLPSGTYYYIVSPKPTIKPEIYRGWVTIIR